MELSATSNRYSSRGQLSSSSPDGQFPQLPHRVHRPFQPAAQTHEQPAGSAGNVFPLHAGECREQFQASAEHRRVLAQTACSSSVLADSGQRDHQPRHIRGQALANISADALDLGQMWTPGCRAARRRTSTRPVRLPVRAPWRGRSLGRVLCGESKQPCSRNRQASSARLARRTRVIRQRSRRAMDSDRSA